MLFLNVFLILNADIGNIDIVSFLFSLLQDTNVLGFKGPRKMTVIIPGMTQDHQRIQITPEDNSETLLGTVNFAYDRFPGFRLLDRFHKIYSPYHGLSRMSIGLTSQKNQAKVPYL